jgi:hypothetical protein
VEYIHRTARDYLWKPEIWSHIVLDSNESSQFDPHLALLGGIVMELKTIPALKIPTDDSTGFMQGPLVLASSAMEEAIFVDSHHLRALTSLVNEIDNVMSVIWKSSWDDKTRKNDDSNEDHFSDYIYGAYYGPTEPRQASRSSIITLAIRFSLVEYVQGKLGRDSNLTQKKLGRPLLAYLAPVSSQNHLNTFKANLAPLPMATLLLAAGSDPNEAFEGNTMWQTLLSELKKDLDRHHMTTFEVVPNHREEFQEFKLMWLSIVELFVQHGADPKAPCAFRHRISKGNYEDRTWKAPATIKEIFHLDSADTGVYSDDYPVCPSILSDLTFVYFSLMAFLIKIDPS